MRVTATFSDGLRRQLDGMAVGDEMTITARARVVAAEEVLVEVTAHGDRDPLFIQGDLEVRLLISHGQVDKLGVGHGPDD